MEDKKTFRDFLLSKIGRFIIIAIGYAVIFGIIYVGIVSGADIVYWIMILLCGFFGWRALNRITPNMFLIMSIGKWGIYYLVKGLLSICVGVFVAPYQISKMIVNKISNR